MSDYGTQYADLEQKMLQKRIAQAYIKARNELIQKLEKFQAKHAKADAAKRAAIAAEKDPAKKAAMQAAYQDWLRGQVFMGRQWEDQIAEITRTMTDVNRQSMNLIRTGQMKVFAENANYEAWTLEKRVGMNLNFSLYDGQTVGRLLRKSPMLLPKWKINEPKDYAWNYGKIKDILTQAILQGEGIPQITKKLAENLCTTNMNRMNTFARTSMTGAQNAGRVERMQEANEEGIRTKKKWLATLDERTRDAHQDLDGETAEVDEPFRNELGEIMYPGDPNADPANTYNCRCTLIEVIDGIETHGERRAYREWDDEKGHHRESYLIRDMTYKEWKQWKEGE